MRSRFLLETRDEVLDALIAIERGEVRPIAKSSETSVHFDAVKERLLGIHRRGRSKNSFRVKTIVLSKGGLLFN